MSFLDSRYRVHLEWMFENQPSLVRQLLAQGKLKEHLDAKEQAALKLAMLLRDNQGLSEDEAFEVAMAKILAPPDGPAMSDDPPEPLPYKEQEVVYRRLNALGDAEERREQADFQKRHGRI